MAILIRRILPNYLLLLSGTHSPPTAAAICAHLIQEGADVQSRSETDDRGEFSFDRLAAGHYTLSWAEPGKDPKPLHELELAPGQQVSGLEL